MANSENSNPQPPKAWLLDTASLLFLTSYYVHLWVASGIPTGDVDSGRFPNCWARLVDLHFSTARGRVHCYGDQWWTDLVEIIANAFGAHAPPALFGSMGGTLVELLWLPILILLAWGWVVGRSIRFAIRKARQSRA